MIGIIHDGITIVLPSDFPETLLDALLTWNAGVHNPVPSSVVTALRSCKFVETSRGLGNMICRDLSMKVAANRPPH